MTRYILNTINTWRSVNVVYHSTNMANIKPRVPDDWRGKLESILDDLLLKTSQTKNTDIIETNALISAASLSAFKPLDTTVRTQLRIIVLKKALHIGNGMKHTSLINSCLISIFFSFSKLQRAPVPVDITSPYKMFTDMLARSEERRVGKECRYCLSAEH